MDFVIVANAWGAGTDNPTSKHRIALELARRGHRVLWIEGAGMRAPSVGSGSDRLRMVRKVLAALKGARKVGGGRRQVGGGQTADYRQQTADGRRQPSKHPTSNIQRSTSNAQVEDMGRCSAFPINHEPLTRSLSLWVLSPLFIPMPKHEAVRQLNGVIGAWSARLWCALLGFKDPVLINYVPVLAEVMRRWGGGDGGRWEVGGKRGTPNIQQPTPNAHVGEQRSCPTASHLPPPTSHLPPVSVVYHCVDRWDAFAMYDSAIMAEMDRRCCEYADCVIASADELRQRCLRWNPRTYLVTHGVDHAHFAGACHLPPSSDLPAGPIIGFFGLLSEWVDQALLLRLARALPQAHLVLIGKADVDVSALKGVSNIHVLGPRPFVDLPAYLANFTVGIIPFVVNDLTRAVNPIKLREMLSGGCPVVSTALPEVVACIRQTHVGGAAIVAGTPGEFEAGVRRFLDAPLDFAARRALSECMRHETWEAKVDKIMGIVQGTGARVYRDAL